MKIGYLLVGCIFLFNPTIHVIDFLPDFIGYLFLMAGTYRMADLNSDVAAARKKFTALMWISLARFLLMPLSGFFDATLKLLCAFSFGIAELIYLIPAFTSLFGGISYLELRLTNHRARYQRERARCHDGVIDMTRFSDGLSAFEVYAKPKGDSSAMAVEEIAFPGGHERVCLAERGFVASSEDFGGYLLESDQARSSTLLFLIIHAICMMLPEFTAIFQKESGYVEASPVYVASRVRPVLLVVAIAVSLVFGIVWLCHMISYFRAFCGDKAFLQAMWERYEHDVLPNEILWTGRRTAKFGTLCALAFLFFFSMQMDYYFLVPEMGWGIMMLFALRAAGNFAAHPRRMRSKLIFSNISSALSLVMLFLYSDRFRYLLYPQEEEGFWQFYLPAIAALGLSMLAYALLISEKKQIYRAMAEKCVHCHPDLATGEHRRAILASLHARIDHLARWEIIFAVASLPLMAAVPFGVYSDLFGLGWAIRMALAVLLMVKSFSLSATLRAELDKVA